jgi:hypothetical protein
MVLVIYLLISIYIAAHKALAKHNVINSHLNRQLDDGNTIIAQKNWFMQKTFLKRCLATSACVLMEGPPAWGTALQWQPDNAASF